MYALKNRKNICNYGIEVCWYLESRKCRNQQGHWTQVFSVNSVHFLYHTLISVKSELKKKSKYQLNFNLWCWATWRFFLWNLKKMREKMKNFYNLIFFFAGFRTLLASNDQQLFNPIHKRVYQDMTQPIINYYISSSHNT